MSTTGNRKLFSLNSQLGYGMNNLKFGERIPGRAKILSLLNNVKIGFGGYAGSNLINIGTKRSEREADHSAPHSTKNARIHTANPHTIYGTIQ